jgi:hypothetical protein
LESSITFSKPSISAYVMVNPGKRSLPRCVRGYEWPPEERCFPERLSFEGQNAEDETDAVGSKNRKTAKRVRLGRSEDTMLNLRSNARGDAPSCETRERSRLNFSMSQFTELPLPCARTCAEGEAAMAGRSAPAASQISPRRKK